MTTPPPPIDIVTVAIALATLLFGPTIAELVGPYSVIVLGAALGGAWSASRREAGSHTSTVGHMLLMIGLALLITVPLAFLGSQYLPIEPKWLLGPVAVVIAGIGQDWPKVGAWLIGQVRSLLESWFSRKGGAP